MAFPTTYEQLGRFQIVSEIGQGAMGVVYKAIDPLLERTVALKTINLALSKEEIEDFEQRFYREAKSAGRLNHPNIVTIYDVGKTENVAFMAMEFLEGGSLRDLLDSGVVLSLERIVDIGAQIAEGLAVAHEAGIVHRDIKPANIMVLNNGTVKITDFGVALIPSASRTMAGVILGSPKYMSPEQVVGQKIDGRSDIFSLGILLYELLTGVSPFTADNISAIMYRILNETPPPPRSVNERVPEAFDYILATALAKHPDARYQSAREMIADLRNYRDLSMPDIAVPEWTGALVVREPKVVGDATERLERTDSIPPRPPIELRRVFARRWWFAGGALVVALAAAGLSGAFNRHKAPAAPPHVARQQLQQPAPSEPPKTGQPAAEEPLPASAPEKAKPRKREPKPARTAHANAPDTSVPASEATPKPRAEENVAPAERMAQVYLAITPWGEVYVDGRRKGVSPPLNQLTLTPGKHRIEIRNTTFAPHEETVDLQPESSKRIKHKF